MKLKLYSELRRLRTFEERFNYLKIGGTVGKETFGFDRYLNQILYHTDVWRKIRRDVIVRDNGCDLGDPDREIKGTILVHHMNPITLDDVRSGDEKVFDPDFLICCSLDTHNAIHYGDISLLAADPVERSPGDTCPWSSNYSSQKINLRREKR